MQRALRGPAQPFALSPRAAPRQDPPCAVPEERARAQLIQAAPCPGSLMERWFGCTSASNDHAACAAKRGCVFTSWSNFTSLPVPSAARRLHRRRRLAAVLDGSGACQLAEIYQQRRAERWDALASLAFQVSHADPKGARGVPRAARALLPAPPTVPGPAGRGAGGSARGGAARVGGCKGCATAR
jgi:hypothetical protein